MVEKFKGLDNLKSYHLKKLNLTALKDIRPRGYKSSSSNLIKNIQALK